MKIEFTSSAHLKTRLVNSSVNGSLPRILLFSTKSNNFFFSKALFNRIFFIYIRCAEFNALSDGIRFQSGTSPQAIQENLRHDQLNTVA